MSLPKEPRQKMINMMYLVLTALLALNVSAEILNAFEIVDKSLKNSNTNITNSNTILYTDLTNKLTDPQQSANAKIWQPLAMDSKKFSEEMYKKIEDIKLALKNEAGAKNGDSTFKKDDLDAATRLFDVKGEGAKLYNDLMAYRSSILKIGQPENKEIEDNFKQILALTPLEGNAKDWTIKNFHMVPTVAALTILTKLQADVKNSENQIATFCDSKLGQVKVKFDTYSTIVGQNTEYTMPGGSITIRGGVGAYAKNAAPKVYINGSLAPLNSEGFGELTLPSGGPGNYTANVRVDYTDINGNPQSSSKEVKWVVGKPGSSSVSADLMNALYIGVPNPVTVGSSSGWDKTNVDFGGLSASGGQGKYSIVPSGPERTVNITVSSDGKGTPFPFRIKYLPPATAYIGGNKMGGVMASAAFKAQGGISAVLEGTPFNANYMVTGYKVWVNNPKTGYQEQYNTGNRWTGAAGSLINGAGPGSSVGLESIKAKGPDGREILVANPTIVFQLR